jgi:DNA-binding MltR family transcriptional regulator
MTTAGRAMTHAQALRKLQHAVDHIAAVLEAGHGPVGDLSEALDLIHSAEGEIEEDGK